MNILGTELHINCTGKGGPTVILEAGLPGSSLDWPLVQPEVAKFTRVCSYDRAGAGWSGLGKQPRTGNQIAEDLHALLSTAGLASPYVLVGHSMGAVYMRIFASKYPDEAIGMVLIDPISEDFPKFSGANGIRSYWGSKLLSSQPSTRSKAQRPPEIQSIVTQLRSTETWKTGEQQETAAVLATFADMQKSSKRLPLIPLIVLSAGESLGWADQAPARAWEHQQLERELSTISALGEWKAVPGADHYIQLTNPSVVVDAVRRVVSAAQLLQFAGK